MESNTKILHPTKRPRFITLDEFAHITKLISIYCKKTAWSPYKVIVVTGLLHSNIFNTRSKPDLPYIASMLLFFKLVPPQT
jgi:hypothetical protein